MFFVLSSNDNITFAFDRVAQMEKLKEQLIEVETSIGRVNNSLSEMRSGRRFPFYVPSSVSQTYQYFPMKADREIRLLYLEPGSGKSRLSCSLRTVPLSKTPIYEALSYTWGKPVFPASIKCSPSGQLCITENLSVALYHLRLKDRIRVLWVDAICINQQDLVERSHQVSLMRDVYKGADHVIVWLGKDNGDARKAFEGLQDLATIHPTSDYDIASTSRARVDALNNLLTRGWFLRIWVIQELVCARKATIMCGNQSMEWERFLDFARTMKKEGSYISSLSVAVMVPLDNLHRIGYEKKQRGLGKQSSLLDLLSVFRECQASDLRDKIFALVGIADGQTIAACTPDYSKDVSEIYRNLASHLIIAERNPDVLTFCVAPPKAQSLSLPSWTPDWSRPQKKTPSPYIRPDAYKASAGTSFKGRIDFNTLSLDGVLLNNIVTLGRAPYPWIDKLASRKMIRKEFIEQGEESFQIFKQSCNYAQSDLTAYVRTLVADVYRAKHRLERQQLLTLCATHRWSVSMNAPNSEFAFSWDEISTTRDGSFGQPVEWQDMRDLLHARGSAALCRRFCLFDDGRVGWVPESADLGDRIAIFLGGTVPILLRPSGNDYVVLGEAYVDEMMDGQAFEGPEVQIETITLV